MLQKAGGRRTHKTTKFLNVSIYEESNLLKISLNMPESKFFDLLELHVCWFHMYMKNYVFTHLCRLSCRTILPISAFHIATYDAQGKKTECERIENKEEGDTSE
jgi:hypothetical protein